MGRRMRQVVKLNSSDFHYNKVSALAEYIQACDSDPDKLGSIEFLKMAVGMANDFIALDEYLQRGGILPRKWREVIGVPKERRPS